MAKQAQRVTTSRHSSHPGFAVPASYEQELYADTPASFVCPNCDGDITEAEHSALGICGDCYFAVSEHVHYQQECFH